MSNLPLGTHSHAGFLPGGWIRDKNFDLNLIMTIALIALLFGMAALALPNLFLLILTLDLWLLGYHHVVSTFTRLVFDRESFHQHRFLVMELPVIVIIATFVTVWLFGLWILWSVYLYWQWFHYTRQSYGLERMFRHSAPEGAMINDRATKFALYMVPLFGILYRSYQASPFFLWREISYLPVSLPIIYLSGGVTALALGYWLYTVSAAVYRGLGSRPHTLYLISHHLIFITGYVIIEDITIGWLVINVWHNLQYILFVWWFNNRRFKNQIDPEHEFLSRLSQRKSIAAYFFVCFGISTVLYQGLQYGNSFLGQGLAVTTLLVTTMILNFHHYLVDGIIWKRKRTQPVQRSAE